MTLKAWPTQEEISHDPLTHPWGVRFDLAYDGGGEGWTEYYRTKLGALLSIVRHKWFTSWGGSAVLFHTMTSDDEDADRQARAYGWEVCNSGKLTYVVTTSKDNPFLDPDWRNKLSQEEV